MIEDINRSKEVNNFKLIKLINGEDIICSIEDGNPNKANSFIEVVYPLRMQIIPKMNNDHKFKMNERLANCMMGLLKISCTIRFRS